MRAGNIVLFGPLNVINPSNSMQVIPSYSLYGL